MKGPLYWLLISDEEKPPERRLSRAPVVWLFFIVNAVWGLACMQVTRRLPSEHDAFLVEVVKWCAGILVMSLPTVILTLREADKSDRKRSFEQFVVAVVIGTLIAAFSGFALEVVLSLLGLRDFLGIPIGKWK
jgi:undecaprenyl pyrophosphate phosphatase UppP